MKKIAIFLLAVVMIISLAGCKKTKEDLKFYVVDGNLVSEGMADDVLLNVARQEGRVAFTGEDLSGWHWEAHRVQLKDVAVLGGARDGGSRLFQAEADDCFILTLGDRLVYAGSFAPASGSVRAVRNPYIQDGEEDTFYLLCDRKFEEGKDPRINETLYTYLADQQLLVSEIRMKK